MSGVYRKRLLEKTMEAARTSGLSLCDLTPGIKKAMSAIGGLAFNESCPRTYDTSALTGMARKARSSRDGSQLV